MGKKTVIGITVACLVTEVGGLLYQLYLAKKNWCDLAMLLLLDGWSYTPSSGAISYYSSLWAQIVNKVLNKTRQYSTCTTPHCCIVVLLH